MLLLGHLILEVGMVLENSPLVGSCPDVVLHHVLLLGEVAVKLQRQVAKITC